MNNLRLLLFIFSVLFSKIAFSQQQASVFGKVTDPFGNIIQSAGIGVLNLERPVGSQTDHNGKFLIIVPANDTLVISAQYTGKTTANDTVFLKPGEKKEINFILYTSTTELDPVIVTGKSGTDPGLQKINHKNVMVIPTPSNGVESIIKTFPGVYSSNELSSQYNVRGGNYDENLVYVNDIEIYRPFLLRNSEQEGLSFLNPDLVSGILFSAGGFEAKYGDKMSSVLDITYRKPVKTTGSFSASLLGFSLHIEDAIKNGKFTYLLGARHKSNRYVLNSMETKGNYKPSFTDVQGIFSWQHSSKWESGLITAYSKNIFKMVPSDRETNFGNLNEALRLKIYFDGEESDNFETMTGAYYATWRPKDSLKMKFIASAFNTNENETYDIMGQYWLYQLETNLGESEFGEEAFERGVGTYMEHARNSLKANVYSLEHKGTSTYPKGELSWGLKFQHEEIFDKISEWKYVDSAGYSIPYPPDSVGYSNPDAQPYYSLELQNVIKTKNNLFSNRISGYLQKSWVFGNNNNNRSFVFIAGSRFNYWDLNKQFTFSPRTTLAYEPSWKHNIRFRLSAGVYHQPPFYRELRDLLGNINEDVKAQESYHFVLAKEWNFRAWNRPFKWTSELYYKYLDNLIPYTVDNVRIKYLGNNLSKGYATGIDLKVNGEFVRGMESWASLSVMKTQEDLKNDYYYDYFNQNGERIIKGYTFDKVAVDSIKHEPGYIPRPTDQRVMFNIFFQDFLPKNPTFRMHLNLVFGTGLPFGTPGNDKYGDTLRIPPYRRVDIGFSKMLKDEDISVKQTGLFRHFKSIWLSLEVFNLLQINNTVSYIWVEDVEGRRYAVPNYLTPRQLNLKLIATF
jgi:hypothetical protein